MQDAWMFAHAHTLQLHALEVLETCHWSVYLLKVPCTWGACKMQTNREGCFLTLPRSATRGQKLHRVPFKLYTPKDIHNMSPWRPDCCFQSCMLTYEHKLCMMDGETKRDIRVCVCVNLQVCALIACGGKIMLILPIFLHSLFVSFFSHASCNNINIPLNDSYPSFSLSLSIPVCLHPCLLSLGVLNFLPISLAHHPKHTLKSPSLAIFSAAFTLLPKTRSRGQSAGQCMLTHPRLNRKKIYVFNM